MFAQRDLGSETARNIEWYGRNPRTLAPLNSRTVCCACRSASTYDVGCTEVAMMVKKKATREKRSAMLMSEARDG